MKKWALMSFLLLFHVTAPAHEPIQKVALFPLTVPASLSKEGDSAWWTMREELTAMGRFLVATKRVMLTKDVFIPRLNLKSSQAIALAQTLDADAVATAGIDDNHLMLSLYARESGSLLWQGKIAFDANKPQKDQLASLAQRLCQKLIVEIPYHGHLTDRSKWSASNRRVGDTLHVSVGTGLFYNPGDEVIFAGLQEVNRQPLFQNGGEIKPVAFGEIVRFDPPIAEVRLVSLVKDTNLDASPVVVVPNGGRRMMVHLGFEDEMKVQLPSEFSNSIQAAQQEKKEETQRITAVLSWVGSLIAMLILAF